MVCPLAVSLCGSLFVLLMCVLKLGSREDLSTSGHSLAYLASEILCKWCIPQVDFKRCESGDFKEFLFISKLNISYLFLNYCGSCTFEYNVCLVPDFAFIFSFYL